MPNQLKNLKMHICKYSNPLLLTLILLSFCFTRQFLLAVGRHTVQGTADLSQLSERRKALTSLKSYKHKNRTVVPSQRTGGNVADYLPGTVKMDGSRNTNSRIEVYQDGDLNGAAGPSDGGIVKIKSVLDSATKRETVHKENLLKAGVWSNQHTRLKPEMSQNSNINFIGKILRVSSVPTPPS